MGHIAHKAVFFIVSKQLAEAIFGFRLLPQDLADSLSGHVSSALVFTLFIVLVARMFFFSSIHCFVPAEWPDPWEEAAEAYCYVEGAYAVPGANLNKTGPAAWEVKVPQTYYYWLPMILLTLAFLLKLPDLLWSLICEQVAAQPFQTLQAAAVLAEPVAHAGAHEEASSDEASSDEASSSGDRAEHHDEASQLKEQLGAHLMRKGKSSAAQPVTLSGSRLFLTYLMSKGVRLVTTLGCLFYLQHSFELSSPMYGIAGLTRQSDGLVDTPAFPTLTFCDVPLRQLGGWNVRTVQCILPINLLVDKTALFLWFWLAACSLILVCSALLWLLRVGLRYRRRRYVKTFARVMLDHLDKRRRRRWWRRLGRRQRPDTGEPSGVSPEEWHRRQTEVKLISQLADTDRVFLLRLIQDRLGMAAAYIALEAMADHFDRVERPSADGSMQRQRQRQFSDPECV